VLTPDQLKKLKRDYLSYDTNGDGILQKEEAMAFLSTFDFFDVRRMSAFFASLTDDGELDFEEFVAHKLSVRDVVAGKAKIVMDNTPRTEEKKEE